MNTGPTQTTSHPQRDKRTWIKMQDPHGRAWQAVIDISAKPKPGPVSSIEPYGWSAPLIPDQKYLKFNPDEMFSIGIDYTSWKADCRAARREWETLIHKTASEMSPHDAGASLIGSGDADYNDASPALLRSVGPKPQAVEPILAAEQGNSWILGKTSRVDPRLKPYFPDPVVSEPDFSDEPDYQDLEEAFDPEATGGKKVTVGKGKRTKTEAAV